MSIEYEVDDSITVDLANGLRTHPEFSHVPNVYSERRRVQGQSLHIGILMVLPHSVTPMKFRNQVCLADRLQSTESTRYFPLFMLDKGTGWPSESCSKPR